MWLIPRRSHLDQWGSHGLRRMLWQVAVRASLVVIVSLGGVVLLSHIPPLLSNTLLGAQANYLMQYSPFGRLPDLMAGVLLGFLYLQRDRFPAITHQPLWLIWLGVAGMLGAIIASNLVGGPVGSPANRVLGFTVAASSSLLVLGMSLDDNCANVLTRLLGSRVMVYLGKLSYGLYLIQLTEPCQWIYWIALGAVQIRELRAILLYIAATVMCVILYELVEKPAQHRLTRVAVRKPLMA